MKKFVLGIGFLVSCSAFAGVDSSLIYNSLSGIEAINVTPRGLQDVVYMEKAVGGLTCKMSFSTFPRPQNSDSTSPETYTLCSIQLEERDDLAIYKALNVKEESLPLIPGGGPKAVKNIASLSCTYSSGVNAMGSWESAQCKLK